MKSLATSLFFGSLFFGLTACTPEQVPTEFEVTVKPQAGKLVESTTQEDEPILVQYEVEDDESASNLTFELVEKPKFGTLKDCKYLSKTKWECVYTPYKNFYGEDTIAFKNKNGDFLADKKSLLKIKIMPVPDKPIAGSNQKFTLMENSRLTFKVSKVNDPDTNLEDLTFKITEQPRNGQLINCFESSAPNVCTFVPTADYYGDDIFTYSVTDKESILSGETSSANVSFNILREWVPVSGVSSIKIEDKASNALIVFAIDNSGSMIPYIDHMKKSVANFIDDITSRGFKATIAFITSDQISNDSWKDIYKKTTPHPDYPTRNDSWLKTWKRQPSDKAVQIYEINAYDAAWNEETKKEISDKKTEIQTYLTNLPVGSDDERLLCSTVRFLHSDHVDGKDFVGIFTLANEDDAVQAGTLEQAFKDCHKEKRQEYKPLASCQETIKCEEGDPACTPKWIYKYTKIVQNPYPAIYQGKCIRQVANWVDGTTVNKRRGTRPVYIEKYERQLDENLIVTQARRTGVEQLYKNVWGNVFHPELVVKETWRKGTKQLYEDVIESVYHPELKRVQARRKGKIQKYKNVYGPVNHPELVVKQWWRKGTKKNPIYEIDPNHEICKEEWITLDNWNGCRIVPTEKLTGYGTPTNKDEVGKCEDLSANEWITCSDYEKVTDDGVRNEVIGQAPNGTQNKDEQGYCADLGVTWLECNDYEKVLDNGMRNEVVGTKAVGTQNKDERGLCEELSSPWINCDEYLKTVDDGMRREITGTTTNGTRNKNEAGRCQELSVDNNWISCLDVKKTLDDGYRNVFVGMVKDGNKTMAMDESGTCEEDSASDWTSCENYTETPRIVDGTKPEQYDCEKIGGNSCDDHPSFAENSCSLKSEAGYNSPTLTPNQIAETQTKKTCLEATGYDSCASIEWDGKKEITKSEGCNLKQTSISHHSFSVENATRQTLANSVAHSLKNDFTKSVYVSVINDLSLNTLALEKATKENIPLPTNACLQYPTRRGMFTDTIDGKTRYMVDGQQFQEVVNTLGSKQASTHGICSPERYPSDKLDYLVADAQLNFKVSEYESYDMLKVTGAKAIYASGESTNLSPAQFVFENGSVTIVDPVLAKNLVELQLTYEGFEK